jgi:WD40 repeat protein
MPRYSLTALLAGALALPASAQQFDRRSRDEPEIVVEAGGRYSTCDALLFDRDGRHLYAGGDDKVVRVWPYSATGLDTNPAKVQNLRWRAWREQRGGIKAVAVSPDGKRVAVGGYGMKPSTVAILDRESGDIAALTWPQSRPGIDSFNTVTAIAFHPDGKSVGFGTADGSLWFWKPEALPQPDAVGRPSNLPRWAGKLPPLKVARGQVAEFNFPRLIHFTDDRTLLAVGQSGDVLSCDIGGDLSVTAGEKSPAKLLFDVNDGQDRRYRVYRAALSGDGKWLIVASVGPQVLLRSIDGKEMISIPLPVDHFPRSIAVHPKTGRLAIGVGSALPAAAGQPRFYAEKNDEIWLIDRPTAGGEPGPKKIAHRGPAEALAFHPTDDRLAVAGGDADEVTLLDLANPEKPVSVVRGAGRRPWAVNIAENGQVIGIQTERDADSTDPNRRGTGDWTRFDLPRLMPTLDESQKWAGPVREADGWSIAPDANDRFTWYAVREQGGKRLQHRLELDRNRDQAPSCFTFLPAHDGKPTRVVVGHYYGCSLFELTPEGAVRTKLYTGHGGEVLSIVAAPDQTWFITGGADQTVVAWNLNDWPSQPVLGAAFEVKDDRLAVTAVDTGSPAWEAGLRVGDALDLLAVGGRLVFDRRPGKKEFGTAATAIAMLKNPRSGIELFFGWTSEGKKDHRESLTTVRQRPVWKWFPAFNDRGRLTDWVIWMWHGSYYRTKSAHGDRLVGWHVNSPEAGGRTQFYQLQQFENIFHRLDVVEKLVNTRDVGAALVAARGDNPLPISFSQFEPAPVRLGLKQSVAGEKGLDVTLTVRPRGNNPDLLPDRVELWVNDYRFEVWPANDRKPLETTLTIPTEALRAGDNQLTVQTFNTAGGRAQDLRVVSNPRESFASNILGLSAGINDYTDHRKSTNGARAFGDLTSAVKDARELREQLLTFRGPGLCFRDGWIDLRLDGDARRDDLTASLGEIAKRAKPDDLLVVFFAGHGDLLSPIAKEGKPGNGSRGGAAGGGLFVFCGPNYSPSKVKETALSADELFEALAKVNCRKVVLLDACHSGRAAEASVLRRFIPDGQGPFVIAACDQGEESYEDPKLGHGLFTYAVLEALGPGYRRADLNADGILAADELYDYVSARVPMLMKEIGKPPTAQHPICFPRQPPQFGVVQR